MRGHSLVRTAPRLLTDPRLLAPVFALQLEKIMLHVQPRFSKLKAQHLMAVIRAMTSPGQEANHLRSRQHWRENDAEDSSGGGPGSFGGDKEIAVVTDGRLSLVCP